MFLQRLKFLYFLMLCLEEIIENLQLRLVKSFKDNVQTLHTCTIAQCLIKYVSITALSRISKNETKIPFYI